MSTSTLSPSQLKVWLNCEEQWRLAYVERLKPKGGNPLFFEKGSYVHEVLHLYYSYVKAGLPVGSERLLKVVTERIKEDLAAELKRAEEEERVPDTDFYRDVAKTITRFVQYISPKIDNSITKVDHEVHLELMEEFYNVNLHGYVDLMYYDRIRKRWVIRDHKTGQSNAWNKLKVEKDIQLLFYGTLWYKLTGEVAIVQINFMNSKPASNPKKTTVLYDLIEAHHTEQTYIAFWKYLQAILPRMEVSQTLQNFNACTNCAYYQICRAGLRGYSAEQIKRANFDGPKDESQQEVPVENSSAGDSNPKPFHIKLGR